MSEQLPYAIMCELRELAGDRPSTNFIPIGNAPPSPQIMHRRRGHLKPMTAAIRAQVDIPIKPIDKYEYSASFQDLVDFGLIRHGWWHDGFTTYGFHLTDKAVETLTAQG